MAKKQSRDKISITLLAIQASLFLAILIPTVLRVESQELLLEFRYNFIKNFVEKAEWYWLYIPAAIALVVLITNIFITQYSSRTLDHGIIRTYLLSSTITLVFLVVVTFSLQSAIGL